METGVTQFGDDWPGVFLRGDSACYIGFLLEKALVSVPDGIEKMQLASFADWLLDCNVAAVQRLAGNQWDRRINHQ